MAHLVIQTGKHRGRKIRLNPGEDFIIGRDESCRLRLASSDVSRQHCVIRVEQQGLTVTDLKSRNGTYVDGFLIESTYPLQPGSLLQVGPMQFLVPGPKSTAPSVESDDSASDHEIASWLTEEGETKEANTGDSTIIPTRTSKPAEPPQASPLDGHPHAAAAAGIIQRYWQNRKLTDSN